MGNNKRERIDFGNLGEALREKGVNLPVQENIPQDLGAAAKKDDKKSKKEKSGKELLSAVEIAMKKTEEIAKEPEPEKKIGEEELVEAAVKSAMGEDVFEREKKADTETEKTKRLDMDGGQKKSERAMVWDKFVLQEIDRLKAEKEKALKKGDNERIKFFEEQIKIAEGINKKIIEKNERIAAIRERKSKELEDKKRKKEIKITQVPPELRKERDKAGEEWVSVKKKLEEALSEKRKKKKVIEHFEEEVKRLKDEFEKAKSKIEEWKEKQKKAVEPLEVKAKEEQLLKEAGTEEKIAKPKEWIRDENEAKIIGEIVDRAVLNIEGEMLSPEKEAKLAQEAVKTEEKIKEMPLEKREEIKIGLRNFGFFVKEKISKLIADEICGNIEKSVGGSKSAGIKGTIGRFFAALGDSYRKDAAIAGRHLEESEKNKGFIKGSVKEVQSFGYLSGEILKYGRTAADIFGWTAGSPLRYVMLGAQFFARGAGAAKEARLRNEELINKTRIHDIEEAANEAWKIYETAKSKYYIETGKQGGFVPKEFLEKSYVENLPKDILERLKNSEPGTATNILARIGQKILKKDVEFAVKRGKFSEASFAERLKELDKMVSRQGVVDSWVMAAKYLEISGKAVVAGVQIETVALLFQRLPELMHRISQFSIGETAPVDELLEQKQRMDLHQKALKIVEARQMQQALEAAKIRGVSQAIGSAAIEKFATVKQGEGIWHAVYRQLENNPSKFGLKINPEDLNNPARLKEILNQKTGELLARQGFIKSGGIETRISEAGTKVLLDESGKITIKGPTYQYNKAPSIETAKGIGNFSDYNLAEQERTLNMYESDIEDFQSKISSLRVKGDETYANVLEKELNRLQEIKTNLIKDSNLAANREKFKNFISLLTKETGLEYREYSEIKDMRADRFLEKFGGKWALWGTKKHLSNLAKIIDSYKFSESDKSFLTVDQALKIKSSGYQK